MPGRPPRVLGWLHATERWYTSNMAHASPTSHKATYDLQLGARGRLVLPSRVREELGLSRGTRLILTVEEPGTLRITTAATAAASAQGLLRDLAPGRSLADELIEERRREAGDE